jgi:hypothetical protein
LELRRELVRRRKIVMETNSQLCCLAPQKRSLAKF